MCHTPEELGMANSLKYNAIHSNIDIQGGLSQYFLISMQRNSFGLRT